MSQNKILTGVDFTRQVFNRLKKYRYIVIASAAVTGLLFALYAKNYPLTYTSKAIIFSLSGSSDNSASSSALSLLLGSEGIANFSEETSVNIIELAQSRAIREAVASVTVPSMGNKTIAVLLIEDINSHRSFFKSKIELPENKEDQVTLAGSLLFERLGASINRNNSFILTFTGTGEELVKIISYAFIDKISQFYIDIKREKAKRDYEFATHKVDSLKRAMGSKDYVLITTDKRSLFTNTDKLEYQIPRENLVEDKQLIRNQYTQAVINQQNAAYKLQKDTPLIRVLDKPEPPFDKNSKSAILYGILGVLAGAVLSGGLLISRIFLRYTAQEISRAFFGVPTHTATTTTIS